MRKRSLVALCLVLLSGCGASGVMEAAAGNDLQAFRASLSERLQDGDVDLGEARDIAARLLGRQVESAQGPAGRQGLDSLEGCAPLVETALARRAGHDDELGARAAIIRVQAGLVEPMVYVSHLLRQEDPWRAAAARSLTLPAPQGAKPAGSEAEQLARAGQWRRKLMVDPSRDVRLAALQAAVDAADPADGVAVLEAARLDPFPPAQLTAIEAAGAIGTRQAVLGLKDLWPGAQEEERVAIVGAWAGAARKGRELGSCADLRSTQPHCLAWRQLVRASESDGGMAGLVAGLELVHDASPRQASAAAQAGAAVIERLIDEAPSRIRIEAIQSAPLSWARLLEAVVAAAETEDDGVVVAALGRLTELGGKERKQAIERLRELAKGDVPPADAARLALVRAGDRTVVVLIDKDAKGKSAEQRGRSAVRYARLGELDKALAMLGDLDARVRVRAACAILGMED